MKKYKRLLCLLTALCLFNGLYRPSKKNHIRSV